MTKTVATAAVINAVAINIGVSIAFPSVAFASGSQTNEIAPLQDTEREPRLQGAGLLAFSKLDQGPEIIGLFALFERDREFLSVSLNGKVAIWDLKSGREQIIFPEGEPISACAYFARSNLLAVSQDRKVSLFDLNSRRRASTSPDFGTKSAALEFSPDGKSLLVGGEDGKVYRWKLQKSDSSEKQKIEVERYIGHSAPVTALSYHPFSRMFFSADSVGTIAAWLSYDKDIFGGKYDERLTQTTFYTEDGPRALSAVADATTILLLRISKDGQNVFSALQDGRVQWSLVRGLKLVIMAKTNNGAIYDLQLSPSGELLATVARDGMVKVWKTVSLQKPGQVPGGRELVPELNDFKKDSIGYLTLVKEFPLEAARKLLFLSDTTLVVGESGGRLLELSL